MSIKKTVLITASCAIFMFGFSFALSPLYRMVCKVTAINNRIYAGIPETNKNITIQFVATNNANLPWEFHPEKNTLIVHPEQTAKIFFYVKNTSRHTMTVQAVPSFAPSNSARYFHKLECFCFTQQTLRAGEEKNMPVVFRVDHELPADINVITLAYTLFDVTSARKSG